MQTNINIGSIATLIDLRTMSFKVLPSDLKDCKSYEVYRKELAIRETITDIPKEKRGAILAARLPNESNLKKDLKDKFFESVEINRSSQRGRSWASETVS